MNRLIILCILTIHTLFLWGQTPDDVLKCGQSYFSDSIHAANPELKYSLEIQEQKLQSWIQSNAVKPKTQSIISIPIVFHVLYTNEDQNVTDEQILSQLRILNEDYRRLNPDTVLTPNRFKDISADTEIEFCLAQQTPDGQLTTGITRKQTTVNNIGTTDAYYRPTQGGTQIWNPKKYLNVWICEINDTLLGYTYLPGEALPAFDGIVLNYKVCGDILPVRPPYNGGRTLVHEIGHWLNLKHPWGDQESCSYDDGVTDTPTSQKPNTQCPTGVFITCNNGPDGDMFMNYMDYTFDNCQNAFTYGQKSRMLATLNTTRETLLNSNGCVFPDTSKTFVESIEVFPNPVLDIINLRFNLASQQMVEVTMYDLSGKLVMKTDFLAEQDKLVMDFPNVSQGTYIMKISSNQLNEQFKLIKIE